MGSHPHGAQGDEVASFLLVHDRASGPDPWPALVEALRGRGHQVLALAASGTDPVREMAGHVVAGESVLVGLRSAGPWVRQFATQRPDVARGVATLGSPAAAGLEVPGGELRVAVVYEGDTEVDYDEQRAAALAWRAQPTSVPGGALAHQRHATLVATLLANWLAPESI